MKPKTPPFASGPVPTAEMPELWSASRAVDELGISWTSFWRWHADPKSGFPQAQRHGGRLLWDPVKIREFSKTLVVTTGSTGRIRRLDA